MAPLPALRARPLELDMRCGIQGGDSAGVTSLDQREREFGESDKLSLLTPSSNVPRFGENDLSRNSLGL